jgi:hypothetical protein
MVEFPNDDYDLECASVKLRLPTIIPAIRFRRPAVSMASTKTSWYNDMTTVLVGPEKERFVFHTTKLRRVPFFQGCLDSNMNESIKVVVSLPEDDLDAFQEVACWI